MFQWIELSYFTIFKKKKNLKEEQSRHVKTTIKQDSS